MRRTIREGEDKFLVTLELSAGPDFRLGTVERFLKAYRSEGDKEIPECFDFKAVTATENPGGVSNVEPEDMFVWAKENDLLGELDFVPHISCKDKNADAIKSTLETFRQCHLDSVIALTGDKPLEAKGVFELDSLSLISLIRKINNRAYEKAPVDKVRADIHQFCCGAAVSPFKYTEASQMQQYYKMEKKIKSGAEFLVTQVGWDCKKSVELFRYMQDEGIKTPVLGNVYLLTTANQAPRLMHDVKLTGCYVSDELLEKLYEENFEQHLERAAQQVAMYRDIGAAGVHIGGVHDFGIFKKILTRAEQIGKNWVDYKENLSWGENNGFYLYNEQGKRVELSKPSKRCKQRFFNFFHRAVLNPDYKGFHIFRKVMKTLGADKHNSVVYKTVNASEKAFKYLMFECEECGDCYLPENFSCCTIGGCEKGLDNAPCGDATVDGYCGNDLERVCIGELIYKSAAAEKNGLKKLKNTINSPRKPDLEHTSSILNYLFGKDHTMKNPIIYIGESIHASIPKTGRIMKQLADMGDDAYEKPSEQLEYIKALIESQAADGADYIAVNVDAFGEINNELAISQMKEYVKMIRKWGGTVPVCIDSSDDEVLKAGLKQWYNTAEKVKQPLINSIKVYTMDEMLPLKKHYDFSFIGLLMSQDKPEGEGGSHSVEELFGFAKQIFDKAVNEYGFKPEEIFFDSTVFPLAIDMPMQPGVPGYTYRAFETVKKIKNDPKMKNAHCSFGVSNCARDLPARKIGICRAYVAKAMEYGLDAGIVNTKHQFGKKPADPELVKLIDAYAKMDGSPEKMTNAMQLMGDFCRKNKKPTG
jgi:methylenetetrahydrofolate reductase (NADPH)